MAHVITLACDERETLSNWPTKYNLAACLYGISVASINKLETLYTPRLAPNTSRLQEQLKSQIFTYCKELVENKSRGWIVDVLDGGQEHYSTLHINAHFLLLCLWTAFSICKLLKLALKLTLALPVPEAWFRCE